MTDLPGSVKVRIQIQAGRSQSLCQKLLDQVPSWLCPQKALEKFSHLLEFWTLSTTQPQRTSCPQLLPSSPGPAKGCSLDFLPLKPLGQHPVLLTQGSARISQGGLPDHPGYSRPESLSLHSPVSYSKYHHLKSPCICFLDSLLLVPLTPQMVINTTQNL